MSNPAGGLLRGSRLRPVSLYNPAMRLMREVRVCLEPGREGGPVLNAWSGWPASDRIVPFLVLRLVISGLIDPRTGYLCNIAILDRLVRQQAVPYVQRVWADSRGLGVPAAGCLMRLWELLAEQGIGGPELESLELATTPHLSFAVRRGGLPMIVMTESFEFAASHRLYCRDLGDDENREIFGKCSNPSGHGHNYVVEVSVRGRPDERSGTIMDHEAFQRTVKQQVIDHFDHKHLNADCPEFADLNPTVENIARVIWDRLAGRFEPAELDRVRVWETPKTYAEYSGK